MAKNELLANRIRLALVDIANVTEKKMFRGTAFMVNDKLCMSAGNDEMMCRIDPALLVEINNKAGWRPMLMKGRELKGYVMVNETVIKTNKDLNFWIEHCLDFNKRAKLSRKKKK